MCLNNLRTFEITMIKPYVVPIVVPFLYLFENKLLNFMIKTISSTSGTVKYRIKDANSKNETSIILDYSFGRNNRIKFATGYKVKPKNWDKVNQRIRSVSTIQNREKVNSDLLKFSSDFLDAVSKLEEEEKQNTSKLKILLTKIIRKKE